jgi:hypothetical protein
VVDTNVAVVANGRDTHASVPCCRKAVELLMQLHGTGCIVIDGGGVILAEYSRRLHPQGQPGVGDRFYRHVIDNQGNTRRVRTVEVDQPRGAALKAAFDRGTLAKFDPADRTFALCSAVGRAPVATATDSDWVNHESGLMACGVRIDYVCGRALAASGGVEPLPSQAHPQTRR